MAVEYKRRQERRGSVTHYTTAGASEIPFKAEIVFTTDENGKVEKMYVGDGVSTISDLKEHVGTGEALRDALASLQPGQKLSENAIQKISKIAIATDSALAQGISGRVIEVRNGATVSVNYNDLDSTFAVYVIATGVTGYIGGDYSVNIPAGTGGWLVNTDENGFKFITAEGSSATEGALAPLEITGDVTITPTNKSQYHNREIYVRDGALHTITVKSTVYPNLNLFVTSGEIRLTIEDAPAGSINNLTPDDDGKIGMLKITSLNSSYVFNGTQNAVYVQETPTTVDILGVDAHEVFGDFNDTKVEAGFIGLNGNYTLARNEEAAPQPAKTFTKPSVDVNGWAIFDGVDNLLSFPLTAATTEVAFVALIRVQDVLGEQAYFGLSTNDPDAVAVGGGIIDKVGFAYLRNGGNPITDRNNESGDPAYPITYTAGDALMIYVHFDAAGSAIKVANLADASYAPEAWGEALILDQPKEIIQLGGRVIGTWRDDTPMPGEFKEFAIAKRALTATELSDIFKYYKTII